MRYATCHPDRPHVGNGFCAACYHAEWRRRPGNSEKQKTTRRKSYQKHKAARYSGFRKWKRKNHLSRFGFPPGSYDYLLSVSGGCEICGAQPTTRLLSADHDHVSGGFRGLLCLSCNTGLGHFRDNPELLTKAINYLRTKTPTPKHESFRY